MTDRKGFFKSYLLDLFEGIDNAFGEELSGFSDKFPDLVRPPGACSEREFIEKCSRCGDCVKACPFFVLKPVLMANDFDRGTPTLRTGEAYCRFCKDFPCIGACRSGALSSANTMSLRRIATANIIPQNCLRSKDTDCRGCFEKCRETFSAIDLAEGINPPAVNPEKCTGCGACLAVCPAYPDPAIRLEP